MKRVYRHEKDDARRPMLMEKLSALIIVIGCVFVSLPAQNAPPKSILPASSDTTDLKNIKLKGPEHKEKQKHKSTIQDHNAPVKIDSFGIIRDIPLLRLKDSVNHPTR